MRSWLATGAAVIALAVVIGGGTAAGYDAAGQLDRFYTVARLHESRPAMPQSRSSEWVEDLPTYADVPPVGSPRDAGPAERAFFDPGDLTDVDRAVERAAPVRVHRGHVEEAAPSDTADDAT